MMEIIMKITCKVKDKRRILPMVLRMWENQMHFLCVLVMKRWPSFWSVNFIELFIAFRVENQNKTDPQSCSNSGHWMFSFPAKSFLWLQNLWITVWNIVEYIISLFCIQWRDNARRSYLPIFWMVRKSMAATAH